MNLTRRVTVGLACAGILAPGALAQVSRVSHSVGKGSTRLATNGRWVGGAGASHAMSAVGTRNGYTTSPLAGGMCCDHTAACTAGWLGCPVKLVPLSKTLNIGKVWSGPFDNPMTGDPRDNTYFLGRGESLRYARSQVANKIPAVGGAAITTTSTGNVLFAAGRDRETRATATQRVTHAVAGRVRNTYSGTATNRKRGQNPPPGGVAIAINSDPLIPLDSHLVDIASELTEVELGASGEGALAGMFVTMTYGTFERPDIETDIYDLVIELDYEDETISDVHVQLTHHEALGEAWVGDVLRDRLVFDASAHTVRLVSPCELIRDIPSRPELVLPKTGLAEAKVSAKGSFVTIRSGYYARSMTLCPQDLDESGYVDFADLLVVLRNWGPCASECQPSCAGDIDGDCEVGFADLLRVLATWGPCT